MKKEGHSGIYLLPNLFTTSSLFAAFYSIVASMTGHYDSAVIAIYIGMIADGLDGRIARLTNTQSAFGAEYDSLSDMVTFGVAPSLLLYSSKLNQLGKTGWLIAFVYTAATALRLARFNTQVETADKRYFQGLASPAAAAFIASFVWVGYQHDWNGFFISVLTAFFALAVALLMVSNVRYYSFKDIDFHGKVPFLYVLFIVICFVAIAVNPAKVILIGSGIYILSGPINTIYRIYGSRRKLRKK